VGTTYDTFTYTTSPWSNSSTSVDYGYVTSDYITLSKEQDMASFSATSKKKKDNGIKFHSKIVPWVMQNIGFDAAGAYLLLYSPLYNVNKRDICRDFSALRKKGYATIMLPIDNYNCASSVVGNNCTSFNHIFVDGVLEHMPGAMAQALFLKGIMAALYAGRTSYLILSSRSREQIRKEAERSNYPVDGKGYLITLPDKKQSRIEGLDYNEVKSIIAYGRIGPTVHSNILKELNNTHLIVSNWS